MEDYITLILWNLEHNIICFLAHCQHFLKISLKSVNKLSFFFFQTKD